jgi:DNA-binding beta-propeller fold protein YncE
MVSVGPGPAVSPPAIQASLLLPTASAPFQALPAANGTVFVGEANGLQVFAPVAGVLTPQCVLPLTSTLESKGGQWAELAFLPNGVDLAGGIETPGAAFYNVSAAATCTGTPFVVSQGPVSADEGSQAVAVTPDGKYAFVSNEYGVASGATTEGNVGVVSLTYDGSGNVNGGTLLGQITTGGSAIAGMLLSPDGTRLYVTSEVSKNSSAVGSANPVLARTGCLQGAGSTAQVNGILTVIKVAEAESAPTTAAIVTTVDAGCSPVRMAETADNSTLWVAARGDNRVLAFSTGMLEVNAANALLGYAGTQGAAPVGVALFHGGQFLAVANSDRFGTGSDANLAIVSTAYPAGAAVVTTVAAGLFPREVNVGSDGATLYLTNYTSGSLQVVPTK